MFVSCIEISQDIINNTSWYFIGHNFSRGGSNHHSSGEVPHKQLTKSRVVHKDRKQQQQNKNNTHKVKVSLPTSLTNSSTLPGNDARKQFLMTHKSRGSIIVFSISKSVEPNEEQKVLTSDFGQGITASTER